jgi:hypothetical protein
MKAQIKFGAEIRDQRCDAKLSQTCVADLIGRSQAWLSAVERGKLLIGEDTSRKILAAIVRIATVTKGPSVSFEDLRLPPCWDFKNRKTATSSPEGSRKL